MRSCVSPYERSSSSIRSWKSAIAEGYARSSDLSHDLDALRLRLGVALLEREHLPQGADRDLELVERRLARGQPLQPQPRREQRHQEAVLGVLPGEADQLVRDPGDHGQEQD